MLPRDEKGAAWPERFFFPIVPLHAFFSSNLRTPSFGEELSISSVARRDKSIWEFPLPDGSEGSDGGMYVQMRPWGSEEGDRTQMRGCHGHESEEYEC